MDDPLLSPLRFPDLDFTTPERGILDDPEFHGFSWDPPEWTLEDDVERARMHHPDLDQLPTDEVLQWVLEHLPPAADVKVTQEYMDLVDELFPMVDCDPNAEPEEVAEAMWNNWFNDT